MGLFQRYELLFFLMKNFREEPLCDSFAENGLDAR